MRPYRRRLWAAERRKYTRGQDTDPLNVSAREHVSPASPIDTVPLAALLDKVRRRKACVVAIGLAVLDGLTELHGAGRWHGNVDAGHVHVGRDGSVRLTLSTARSVAKGEPERALRTADVRAAGMLLCSLLRIRPASRQPVRASTTPLGIAVRAMATSVSRRKVRAGYEASQARLSLWEAAGRLASRQRQALARQQLAELVLAELAREAAPVEQVASVLPLAAVPTKWGEDKRGVATLVAVLGGCALLTIAMLPGIAAKRLASGEPPAVPASVIPAPPAHDVTVPAATPPPLAAATPSPPPQLAPSSAGDVEQVSATIAAGCQPGSTCMVTVAVRLRPAPEPRPVDWTLTSIDSCTGATTTLATGEVTAQAGWVRIVGWRQFRLPASPVALVAVTESPARAASTPVPLTGPPPNC